METVTIKGAAQVEAQFKYQWSKRMDARHTISLHGCETLDAAMALTGGWRRDLRVFTPWRITDAAGTTLAYGEGGSNVVSKP